MQISRSFLGDSRIFQKENISLGCGQHWQDSATSAASSPSRLSQASLTAWPVALWLLCRDSRFVLRRHPALRHPTQPVVFKGQGSPSRRFYKVRGDHGRLRETQADWGLGRAGKAQPSSAVHESTTQRSKAQVTGHRWPGDSRLVGLGEGTAEVALEVGPLTWERTAYPRF